MHENKKPLSTDDMRLLLECGILGVEQLRLTAEESMIQSYEYKIFQSCGLWYVRLPDGKRIRRKNREDLERIILDIQRERLEGKREKKGRKTVPSAEAIFEAWQEKRLASRLALGSTVLRDRRTYTQHLAGTDISRRPIGDTSRQDWTAFLQKILDDQKPTAKAFARIKSIVKDILHQAEDGGYIDYTAEDVLGHIRIYKKSFAPPAKREAAEEVYLPDELAKLKAYCLEHEDPYTRCILMSIITGTRPGECAPCHIDDVDLDSRTLSIRRTETGSDDQGRRTETVHDGAKTAAGIRVVSIPECDVAWVRETIEAARRYSDVWLFPQEPGKWKTRYTGQRIRTPQLRRHLRSICGQIGIPYKSPHKLRKTYASILAAADVPDTVRIAQMGHTDIKTTKKFYEFDRETNGERAEALGKIAELQLPAGSSSRESPRGTILQNC